MTEFGEQIKKDIAENDNFRMKLVAQDMLQLAAGMVELKQPTLATLATRIIGWATTIIEIEARRPSP
jgi:hypothetical protein